MAAQTGGAAYNITTIDSSNPNYDTVILSASLGVTLTGGQILFEAKAAGESGATYKAEPKGLLYQDLYVGPGADVAVVIRGTVYERRIPMVPGEFKAKMRMILFSKA